MMAKRVALNLLLVVSASVLTGCMGGRGSEFRSWYVSSVPDFLYPSGGNRATQTEFRPAAPLRVGIVFVPGKSAQTVVASYFHTDWRDMDYRHELREDLREELLEAIAAEFRSHPSIKTVQVLPSSSLMDRGGFDNLDLVRARHGVDVVALLSYDQVNDVKSGVLSVTYWSFVGMLFIPAERSETSTMIDAAVVDIASRRMLFRAPGTSGVTSHSTPAGWSARMRQDSANGFRLAVQDLIPRLQDQMKRFEAKAQK